MHLHIHTHMHSPHMQNSYTYESDLKVVGLMVSSVKGKNTTRVKRIVHKLKQMSEFSGRLFVMPTPTFIISDSVTSGETKNLHF